MKVLLAGYSTIPVTLTIGKKWYTVYTHTLGTIVYNSLHLPWDRSASPLLPSLLFYLLPSSYPCPQVLLKNWGRVLVSLAKILVYAKSAYYTTHPNNYILCHRLVTFVTCKCSKECYNWQWRTWFLYSKRRLLTQHIRESLQVTPGPFPDFWVGPGDEASCCSLY